MLDKDASNNILNANEISNYCFRINGNKRTFNEKDNYILHPETNTFDCIDAWRIPDVRISENGPFDVSYLSAYDDNSFAKVEDAAKYCNNLTGSTKTFLVDNCNNIINNFTFYPSDPPSILCRNPSDINYNLLDLSPKWNQNIDVKVFMKNDVDKKCKELNGNHEVILDPLTSLETPLTKYISFVETGVKFDCASYWGGVVTREEFEKKSKISDVNNSSQEFDTIEDVKEYCKDLNGLYTVDETHTTFFCGEPPPTPLSDPVQENARQLNIREEEAAKSVDKMLGDLFGSSYSSSYSSYRY